jgi:hypothetical protein
LKGLLALWSGGIIVVEILIVDFVEILIVDDKTRHNKTHGIYVNLQV